jgi:hypothetical protein
MITKVGLWHLTPSFELSMMSQIPKKAKGLQWQEVSIHQQPFSIFVNSNIST